MKKLNAYGFTLLALKLVHDYLSDRKQRTRVNNSYSTWFEILFGVLQGSIRGPLLFNIFLVSLFFIFSKTDIANYADGNMLYTSSNDVNGLIKRLEEASKELIKWFDDNLMKANPDKCHLFVNTNNNVSIRKHAKKLSETYEKASKKLYALGRVNLYMNLSKTKILMDAFFNSQFSYCPLVWMFNSRIIDKKTNRLHERCLKVHQCRFENLPKCSCSYKNDTMKILYFEF